MRVGGIYLFSALFALWLPWVCPEARGQGEEAAGSVEEGSTAPSIALDAAFNSRYVWRGIGLSDDLVLQPSASLSFGGLTASLWGNLELTNSSLYPGQGETAGEFTEADYVLDYTRTVLLLDLSVGFIHYRFPNTGSPATTELYGAAAFPFPFSPAVTFYRDIDQALGSYAAVTAGYGVDVLTGPATIGLDLSVSVAYGSAGYHQAYYGLDKAAFSDAMVTAALPVALGRFLTLAPSVGWSRLIDSDIADRAVKRSHLWFGLMLSLVN